MNTYPTNSIELGSCKPGMPLWNRAASWWPDFHHTYLRGPITTIGAMDALVRIQNAGVYGPANEIVYCVERPKPGLMLGVCISGDVGYEFQIIMPDPYRSHECTMGHEWDAPVKWDKTFNLTGEATQYCPECGGRSEFASAWKFRGSDPTPAPVPEPCVLDNDSMRKLLVRALPWLESAHAVAQRPEDDEELDALISSIYSHAPMGSQTTP